MHVKIYFTAWHCGARDVGAVVYGDTKLIINIKKSTYYIVRAHSIGDIWLFWIRVRAFGWSDPDPDPLDRDLVNPATVQYNRISRSTCEAHGMCWNRGRSIENQLLELLGLLGLLDPNAEQPNSTNRMRTKWLYSVFPAKSIQ